MDEYPIFETPFKQTKPMNLSNHFLIAMPSMHDPIFGGTVVYLCEHNDYGALGVVINRPMELTLDHLLPDRQRWILRRSCRMPRRNTRRQNFRQSRAL